MTFVLINNSIFFLCRLLLIITTISRSFVHQERFINIIMCTFFINYDKILRTVKTMCMAEYKLQGFETNIIFNA